MIVLTDSAKNLANSTVADFKEYPAPEIKSNDDYQAAGELLKKVKGKYKELEGMRTSITKPLNTAKKQVDEFFRGPKEVLKGAETKIKAALVTYDNEQERIRREEQRKIDEQRAAQEAQMKKEAEQAALAALDAGEVEKAEAILETKDQLVVVAPKAQKASVAGISYRTVWRARVVDFTALPDDYKLVNTTALGKVAREKKEGAEVPGVEFYSEKVAAA